MNTNFKKPNDFSFAIHVLLYIFYQSHFMLYNILERESMLL